MERSDGRLATVSYLFGAPVSPEQAPSERGTNEHNAPRGVPRGDRPRADGASAGGAPAAEPIGDTAGPAANGRHPASGWYIEPGDVDAPSSRDDEPVEDEPEPEPPSIAAARRFLSLVETRAVDSSAVDRSAGDRAAHDSGAVPGGAVDAPSGRAAPSARVRFVEQKDSAATAETPKPPPVRKASINALARKGMSSAEMVSLLENREIDPEEVAAEVERLESAGLLDDRVLAADLVNTLRDRKGLGKSAITAELRRRRVDPAAIDEALESVDFDDELERATEVAIKRAGQLSSYDRATAERRLSAFLQRRGYAGSVVGAAVNAALGPAGPRFR